MAAASLLHGQAAQAGFSLTALVYLLLAIICFQQLQYQKQVLACPPDLFRLFPSMRYPYNGYPNQQQQFQNPNQQFQNPNQQFQNPNQQFQNPNQQFQQIPNQQIPNQIPFQQPNQQFQQPVG